jgi:hypothetical protein
VAETAAHLVGDVQHYTEFLTGERDPSEYLDASSQATSTTERNAIGNARLLVDFPERDLGRLADLLPTSIEAFVEESGKRSDTERILTATGLSMTVPEMSTSLLGEQLVHGFDIARAVGRNWPISRQDALLVLSGSVSLMPAFVDREATRGLHVSYELRFRGGPRYRLAIDDGSATVSAAGEKVDCWISADPVSFLLVGYGRIGQWGQAFRGRLVSGGHKPWLGLKFGRLITGV